VFVWVTMRKLDPSVRLRALQEALENVERVCGYKLVSILPFARLRWLESRSVLRHVLAKLAINCVLDVGANQGQYGMVLRGLGYKGWILSFEPIKANCEVLENVAKRNGPWRVFQYALGAANCRSAINVAELSIFSSFLTAKEDSQLRFPKSRVERREEVEVRRLDDILETCLSGIESPRIYLKMDTQGFDLEVMKGAESALASVSALQTEVSFRSIYAGMPGFMESIKEFQARGFDVVDFLPVSSEADGLCAIEMDCVMARQPQRVSTG
jgi:FkbM family methyltransferase